MSVEGLIANLSADLKPVTPLKSIPYRLVVGLGWSALVLICGVSFWFWRKGEFNIPLGRSLVEASLLLACFAVAIWRAILSMSPHTSRVKASRFEWLFFGLWIAVIGVAFVLLYNQDPSEALVALQYNTWACPKVVFSIAVPAAGGLFWYLQKGAPLYPRNMARSWSVAVCSLGLFGLAFICPWADPMHELIWHVLPASFGIFVFFMIAHGFGRRDRS